MEAEEELIVTPMDLEEMNKVYKVLKEVLGQADKIILIIDCLIYKVEEDRKYLIQGDLR